MLGALLLGPLGTMIIGSLVAEKLQLAARGAFSLSVIAVILVVVIGFWIPSLYENVPICLLVLTAVNLLIGYSTGMHRRWSPPPGTPSSAS